MSYKQQSNQPEEESNQPEEYDFLELKKAVKDVHTMLNTPHTNFKKIKSSISYAMCLINDIEAWESKDNHENTNQELHMASHDHDVKQLKEYSAEYGAWMECLSADQLCFKKFDSKVKRSRIRTRSVSLKEQELSLE